MCALSRRSQFNYTGHQVTVTANQSALFVYEIDAMQCTFQQ